MSTQAPPITWSPPANIVYGTKLGSSQLDATDTLAGTFVYTPAAGTLLSVGTQTLSVTFTPTDTTKSPVSATTTITVTQATPAITWADPDSILLGTALGASQLDATASVPGKFTYNPGAGTVLGVGTGQTLSVSFAPTDSTDYTTATATVTINVNEPITPTITWANPASIVYGTALSSSQLDATANTFGTFAYAPASGTLLGAGNDQTLSVTFTPTDNVDYTTATATATINITQATPTITWANPANIVEGTPLGTSQLNATANVPGQFTYEPAAGTVLTAGNESLSVSFTPTDTFDYTTASDSVSLFISLEIPTITWAIPGNIVYGTALGASQLDATASVPGTFSYSPAAGTVLGAGNQTLSLNFTPTDLANYARTSGTTTLTVTKATPTITWGAPDDITYGTPLSAADLDATASVPGTFEYTGPTGGTLVVVDFLYTPGVQQLNVVFTPTDSTDYTTANEFVNINEGLLVPTITWSPGLTIYGTALGSQQLDATTGVPGTFTYSPSAGTVLGAGTQTLSVTFTPQDTRDILPVSDTVKINVAQLKLGLQWPVAQNLKFGVGLSYSQFDATASVPGTFSYSEPAGYDPSVGNDPLTVTFTPTDSTDYAVVTDTVTLNVTPATPTITWANLASITAGTALGASQLDATANTPGTFTYSPAAGTVPGVGNQTLSVVFTPTDSKDYTTASATTTLSVAVPVAPVFLGEQRVYSGKGKKAKLVGFELRFNAALNAGLAHSVGEYHVTQKNGKKLKTLPVKSAVYNSANFSVQISVPSFSTSKATQVTIAGMLGANGAAISQIVAKL